MGCPALGIWVGFLKQPALPSEAPQIFFYHIQYLSKNFYYYINSDIGRYNIIDIISYHYITFSRILIFSISFFKR
jgi:hypothetical protein